MLDVGRAVMSDAAATRVANAEVDLKATIVNLVMCVSGDVVEERAGFLDMMRSVKPLFAATKEFYGMG